MKIGMIGAGSIGQALAKLVVAQGHEVMLSNSRGPETLSDIALSIGCLTGRVSDAVTFGEIIVLSIPFKNIFALRPSLLEGKIVIDTNNYYPDLRDGHIADLDEHRTTTSGMVAAHFPGAKVVKAFNAILALDLEDPVLPASGKRRVLPIAGNDTLSKHVVTQLHQQIGYDVVDMGNLDGSWRFERAKPAYCIPLDADGLRAALNQADREMELPEGSWRQHRLKMPDKALLSTLGCNVPGTCDRPTSVAELESASCRCLR